MPAKSSKRCTALTRKGERCKNLALTRGRCSLHRSEQLTSKSERIAVVSAVISSSAALVTLIEKLIKYWPDILYIIESLGARISHASWRGKNSAKENERRLRELRNAKVVGSFFILRNLLENMSRTNRKFPILPITLKDELIKKINSHQENLHIYWAKKESLRNEINFECISYLNATKGKYNLLYRKYREYQFSLFNDELIQNPPVYGDTFELRLSRFEDMFPMSDVDFINYHSSNHYLCWELLGYVNYLHFLSSETLESEPYLVKHKTSVGPLLKDLFEFDDLEKLNSVHSRMVEKFEYLCLMGGP